MSNNRERIIRVGSRKSQLALIQTNITVNMLQCRYPALHFEVVQISTIGDKILDVPLSKIGDKSLFTKELEHALLNRTVDFVVHSLKDVPTVMPNGLVLGCVFDRCSPEDVVLMSPFYRGYTLSDLPEGAVVGTSALRRVATIARLHPHLRFVSVRGNLNTRLKKLDENCRCSVNSSESSDSKTSVVKYDALVLAKAGIERLGWSHRIDQVLSDCLHAVGQGALACECRKDDQFVLSVLAELHNECAALSSIAERSLMRHLDGGCSTPIGVRYLLTPNNSHPRFLQLQAAVLSVDGHQCVRGTLTAELPDCVPQDTKRPRLSTPTNTTEACSVDVKILEFHQNSSRPSQPVAKDTGVPISLDRDPTQDELELATDQSACFMGVHVNPICAVARLRMARAERLGKTLANHLLSSGAADILDEIRACQKTHSS